MTQKIFDVDNEKDYTDLWDILPDSINKIKKAFSPDSYDTLYFQCGTQLSSIFKIDWHDKTEITRPIQEATENDKGKLCKFWRGNETCCHYGILFGIDKDCPKGKYMMSYSDKYSHCRRLS